MEKIIVFTAILGLASAFPALLLTHELHPVKSTITKSSQVVDHGSTVHAVPVVPVAPLHVAVSKVTETKNSHSINHGSTHTIHAVPLTPVVPVYQKQKTVVTKSDHLIDHGTHVVPQHVAVHTAPVLVHTPLVSLKTADSAVSHLSSTVHESVPLVAVHH